MRLGLSIAVVGGALALAVPAGAAPPSPTCRSGAALLAAGEKAQAEKIFVQVLQAHPAAVCASDALKKINAPSGTSFGDVADDVANWIPKLLILLLAAVAAVFVGAIVLGRIGVIRRLMLRIPYVGDLVAPRLSIAAFDDSCLGDTAKVGEALAARTKAWYQHYRQALDDTSGYDLDYGSSSEAFADIVSGTSGFEDAIDKAKDISDQSKTVAALLGVLYALLPIRKISIAAVLDTGTTNAVSATLTLQDGNRQAAAATLSASASASPTLVEYSRLARPSALWIHYETARLRTTEELGPDAAASFAFLREGLDRQFEGKVDLAKLAYERALRIDPKNWAARLNLAQLKRRTPAEIPAAIELVRGTLSEMRQRNVKDSNYFRLSYFLAAVQLNEALRRSDPTYLEASLEAARDTVSDAFALDDEYAERARRRRSWLRWWRGLRADEERLLRFVRTTVLPTTELVQAGALAERGESDREFADSIVDRIRADAADGDFSYRVYYNLACYSASKARRLQDHGVAGEYRAAVEAAFAELETALVRAVGDRRQALIRIAGEDASLDHLHTTYKDRFHALMNRYDLYSDVSPEKLEA
jgi:tetratricopeptide (TPR) repeat protein